MFAAEAIRGHNRGPPNAPLPALTWSLCRCRCPYWPPIARVSTCVEVRPPIGSMLSRVKSSAELEEEMLANIPKFRARPFNKKEFHLKTMVRATRHADTCSRKLLQWGLSGVKSSTPYRLCHGRCAVVGALTGLRLHVPPTGSVQSRVKSSAELEEEMLANIPKFRARPFNKKSYATCRHMFSEASSVGTVRSESSKPLTLAKPKPPNFRQHCELGHQDDKMAI
uniref:Uncharacterized protein n=1 Tax=Oryza glumipatula TaxID=40148 RepID=A0A0D9YRL5_9ORYZ